MTELCHSESQKGSTSQGVSQLLLIVGPPNVGKSLIFNRLTGRHVSVSNYPGTTVDISTGTSPFLPGYELRDTPGAYSLVPISEEERIAREMILSEPQAIIVQVVDAKNLRRMLPFTLELLELRRKVILVLNLMDEARRLGVSIDSTQLGEELGIPVVETVATTGEGLDRLCAVIRDGISQLPPVPPIDYPPRVRSVLREYAANVLPEGKPLPPPAQIVGPELLDELELEERTQFELELRLARQRYADSVLAEVASFPVPSSSTFAGVLNRLTMNVWTAVPIAFAVLYFGVYQFVGQFGAGTLVDFLENDLYETYVTPRLTAWVERLIPWTVLQDLFVHDYGVFTLGLRYAIALILPIVGTFFIMFSILEDSGYLPRLALLLDRVFKKLGLNGRAVIPIILGFGCGTMATVVTRILETRRERIIATLLLGFAIPCSAQLGVILAMVSTHHQIFIAWCVLMTLIFLALGMIAARTVPGRAPAFYLEIPPLRMPRLSNVLMKTYSRMYWYFIEILPLFLFASVIIWVGTLTGLFQAVIKLIVPIIGLMGLPAEAASAFLFGFFRRDYGAAGLLDLLNHGQLNPRQIFVSVLVISLFLPCIAQFFVMKKERGWKFALATSAAVWLTATTVGILANYVALFTGWL
ncbi:MAG: ferrous iron transport protein B [Candidatus Hydrogenedentota bacterium]|jgi:ferrous iron transport protein B|nr:MAG: ferrous iron transport protein B [Candidatus Hydrogenedentota bacterium]